MALWALAWLGSTPIGGPIVGWAGQTIGARWSLVIGGLPTLICGILALPALTRIDRRAVAAEAAAADEPTAAAGDAPAAGDPAADRRMHPVRPAAATSGLSRFDDLPADQARSARRVSEVVFPAGPLMLLDFGVGQHPALARHPAHLGQVILALAKSSDEAISSLSPPGYNGGLTASAARQITRFFGSVSSRMSCPSIS